MKHPNIVQKRFLVWNTREGDTFNLEPIMVVSMVRRDGAWIQK
jgi:hypothetical protein